MKLTLKWQDNEQTNQKTIPLNRIIDLGRASNCQINFNDKTVSRRHAIIYPYKGGIYLQNLSNTNKIWVDRTIPLHKGDSILLQEGISFNIGRIYMRVTAVQTSAVKQKKKPNPARSLLIKSSPGTPAPIFSIAQST